ncbi:MAG: nucleotidyltransferase domain-containing protein [Chloroflexi bacterium]|nr:nucleotidyltransferase domain-containing protein [Chloroflexota bacterium]OJV94156.1 MAG: hypothetical protein BGO39_11865 [Chloroflexi bacterium 54-19]
MKNPAGSAPTRTLETLGQNRDALLKRLTELLRADSRVEAVWLSGSFGRGENDEWSDLDLHVAVKDESFRGIIENPNEFFEYAGKPLLVQWVDGESYSMPGGRFWLVMYPNTVEVDWNIGPVSQAVYPAASQMLFDRVGLRVAPEPAPASLEERQNAANHSTKFFWAMAPIAVKYAGRGHTRLAVLQMGLLEDAFTRFWYALNRPEYLKAEKYHQNRKLEPELDAVLPRLGAVITPASVLAVIGQFCREAEKLNPALNELGVEIPYELIDEQKKLIFQAEIIAGAGGSRPDEGSRR